MPGGAGAQLALRRLDKNIPHIMLPKERREKGVKKQWNDVAIKVFSESITFSVCVCVISEITLKRKRQ